MYNTDILANLNSHQLRVASLAQPTINSLGTHHSKDLPVGTKGEHHDDGLSISSELVTLVGSQTLMYTTITVL